MHTNEDLDLKQYVNDLEQAWCHAQDDFASQQLQEYYAAYHLLAGPEPARLMRRHLHDPRWDQPILLALGLAGLESVGAATALLETAVLAQGQEAARLGLRPSRHEQLLGRDYLFALRCLAYDIPLEERLPRLLIKRLVEQWLHWTGPAAYSPYREALEERLAALEGRAALLVPLLIDGLRDPNEDVRINAIKGLCQLGGVAGVAEVLQSALDDPERRVRLKAVWALGKLRGDAAGAVAGLRLALNDPEHSVCMKAIRALGKQRGDAAGAVAGLRSALGLPDLSLRMQAVLALGHLEVAESVPALVMALDDPSAHVRNDAVRVLGWFGSPTAEVLAALGLALAHPDRNTRLQAVSTLLELETSEEVLALLRPALADTEPRVRVAVAKALFSLGGEAEGTLPLLRAALQDPDWDIRLSAARALIGQSDDADTVLATLLAGLRESDADTRFDAIGGLAWLQGETEGVVAALRAALHDSAQILRCNAVYVLEELGGHVEGVAAALAVALDDEDEAVRERAIAALATQSHAQAAWAVLRGALDHSFPDVRIAAVKALGDLVTTIPEALPALRGALEHTDPEVRYAAAAALGQQQATTDSLNAYALEGLSQAEDDQTRQQLAAYLGLAALPEAPVLDLLFGHLLDRDADVRLACAEALAQIGRRFPDHAPQIEQRLLRTLSDPAFAEPAQIGLRASGHDYAYEALWQLLVES